MSCMLPGCKSRMGTKESDSSNISFHRFPKPPSPAREEWLKFVCRNRREKRWILRNGHRLCSKHFSSDSFIMKDGKRFLLKKDAVPTILALTATKNFSRDVEAIPLRANEALAPATATTDVPHRLNVKTEPLPHSVNEPEMVSHATETTALPQRVNVKPVSLPHLVLKPMGQPSTVTTELPHKIKVEKTVPLPEML